MVVRLLAEREPYTSYARERDPTGSLSFCLSPRTGQDGEKAGAVDLEIMPADRFIALPPDSRPPCPVFAYGPVSLMSAAYEAGCADYLRDPWSLIELKARATRLEALRFSAEGTEFELRGALLSARKDGGVSSVALGEAERRLLRLLVMNAGQAVTRQAIALELWGGRGRSERTPDVYIARLRGRIDGLVPGGGGIVTSCRGLGYRLDV